MTQSIETFGTFDFSCHEPRARCGFGLLKCQQYVRRWNKCSACLENNKNFGWLPWKSEPTGTFIGKFVQFFFSCFNKRQSMEMKEANTMFVHSTILIFLELISWVGSKVNLSCAILLDKAVRNPSIVPFDE